MRRGADGADADLAAFEVGELFESGSGDQDMQRAVEPAHDTADPQTLDRWAGDVPAHRRVVELAGDQRGGLQIGAHDDFAHLEAFVFVKTFSLRDLGGKLVKTRSGYPDVNDFAKRFKSRQQGQQERQSGKQ